MRLVKLNLWEKGIEKRRSESPDIRRSPLQQLAGIGEVAVSSVRNRRPRASGKFHGELAHLLVILLHPEDHRSSQTP
jgi:hypothetical protein